MQSKNIFDLKMHRCVDVLVNTSSIWQCQIEDVFTSLSIAVWSLHYSRVIRCVMWIKRRALKLLMIDCGYSSTFYPWIPPSMRPLNNHRFSMHTYVEVVWFSMLPSLIQVVQCLCETFCIGHRMISSCHPQSNGLCERMNQTIIRYAIFYFRTVLFVVVICGAYYLSLWGHCRNVLVTVKMTGTNLLNLSCLQYDNLQQNFFIWSGIWKKSYSTNRTCNNIK